MKQLSIFTNWFNKFKSKDFDFASLKLAAYYTLIVVLISISFSVILYRASALEIGRGLNKQTKVLRDIPITGNFGQRLPDLEQMLQEQINESNRSLQLRLLYYNLLILIVSSVVSYFLAKKTLEPIKEIVESQNRFTADASHELRTPLTAMRSEIEVNLRDKNLKLEDAKTLLQSNLEEIGKLETLSTALLKLARCEENGSMLHEDVSLSEVLTEAHNKIAPLAEKKSIQIDCDPELDSGSHHLLVRGDHQNLVELIVILLDNAVKYSPENSTVRITWYEEKKRVVIKVKDKGIGIKASDLPYIYNRFYRADTSRNKEKVSGYGLGLSIAKRIIDLHHGTISVASKPGHGTEFTVSLPTES